MISKLYVDSLAKSKFEDCEKPPEVEQASVVVSYDENEEFVTATYRCHDGFKLRGKAEVTCDLDTDEWQETPPTCEQGKNVTVSTANEFNLVNFPSLKVAALLFAQIIHSSFVDV